LINYIGNKRRHVIKAGLYLMWKLSLCNHL